MAAPPQGTIAWALGFLAYIPIPFFNVVISGLTQTIVGMRLRKHGGLAAENGRRAANWGLTQLTWFVLALLCISPIWVMMAMADGRLVEPPPALVALAIGMLVLYLVLGLAQAIYAIIGTVLASQGKVARLPAIPYLRKKS